MSNRFRIHVDKQGRMVLPAPVRKQLGLEEGGQVTLEITEDEAWLTTHWQALRTLQRELAEIVPPGVSLADELIAERRAEVEREASVK